MPNFGYNLSQGLGALGGGLLQGLLEEPRLEHERFRTEEERLLAPLMRLLLQAQAENATHGKPRQLTPEQEAFQEWWRGLDPDQKNAYQRRRAAGKGHPQALQEMLESGIISREQFDAYIDRQGGAATEFQRGQLGLRGRGQEETERHHGVQESQGQARIDAQRRRVKAGVGTQRVTPFMRDLQAAEDSGAMSHEEAQAYQREHLDKLAQHSQGSTPMLKKLHDEAIAAGMPEEEADAWLREAVKSKGQPKAGGKGEAKEKDELTIRKDPLGEATTLKGSRAQSYYRWKSYFRSQREQGTDAEKAADALVDLHGAEYEEGVRAFKSEFPSAKLAIPKPRSQSDRPAPGRRGDQGTGAPGDFKGQLGALERRMGTAGAQAEANRLWERQRSSMSLQERESFGDAYEFYFGGRPPDAPTTGGKEGRESTAPGEPPKGGTGGTAPGEGGTAGHGKPSSPDAGRHDEALASYEQALRGVSKEKAREVWAKIQAKGDRMEQNAYRAAYFRVFGEQLSE